MEVKSKSFSILGIISFIFSLIGFIPVIGVPFIFLALITGGLSLIKTNNTMAVITFAIGFLKFFITPTLWATAMSNESSFVLTAYIILLIINIVFIIKNNIKNKNIA